MMQDDYDAIVCLRQAFASDQALKDAIAKPYEEFKTVRNETEHAHQAQLDILLARFVSATSDDCHYDRRTGKAQSDSGLKLTHTARIVTTNALGNQVTTTSHQSFIASKDRVIVDTKEFRPDLVDIRPGDGGRLVHNPIVTDDETKQRIYNEHLPPLHQNCTGGDAETGFEFVRYVITRKEELEYFLNALAHKQAHPECRGPAHLLVSVSSLASEAHGTGKSMLLGLVAKLLGEENCQEVSFDTFAGHGTPGQWNDYVKDNVALFMHEVQSASTWKDGVHAYNVIKERIDPVKGKAAINMRGTSAHDARVFFTVFMATNNVRAIVLAPNDRRVAVYSCNAVVMPPDMSARFGAWLSDPRNIAAIANAFADRGWGISSTPPPCPSAGQCGCA